MAEIRGKKMNSNKTIRIISAFMAASILFATAGCGNKKTTSPSQELNQPKVEDNTAVIEYTSVNAEGKEEDVTTVVNINIPSINKPVTGMDLAEKLENSNEMEKFENNKENYGLDDKEFEEVVNKAENWTTFNYVFYVANSTSKRILFRKISHTSLDGVLLSNDLGCEYGVPSGSGMTITFNGLVDKSKFDSEDALMDALSKMDIKIIYTTAESINDSIDDWDSIDTKTMTVDFSQ